MHLEPGESAFVLGRKEGSDCQSLFETDSCSCSLATDLITMFNLKKKGEVTVRCTRTVSLRL